jgi:hypothetical protein
MGIGVKKTRVIVATAVMVAAARAQRGARAATGGMTEVVVTEPTTEAVVSRADAVRISEVVIMEPTEALVSRAAAVRNSEATPLRVIVGRKRTVTTELEITVLTETVIMEPTIEAVVSRAAAVRTSEVVTATTTVVAASNEIMTEAMIVAVVVLWLLMEVTIAEASAALMRSELHDLAAGERTSVLFLFPVGERTSALGRVREPFDPPGEVGMLMTATPIMVAVFLGQAAGAMSTAEAGMTGDQRILTAAATVVELTTEAVPMLATVMTLATLTKAAAAAEVAVLRLEAAPLAGGQVQRNT